MGDKINVENIECYRDLYQIDFVWEDSKKSERVFIRKDALLALLCVAEKRAIDAQKYAPEVE